MVVELSSESIAQNVRELMETVLEVYGQGHGEDNEEFANVTKELAGHVVKITDDNDIDMDKFVDKLQVTRFRNLAKYFRSVDVDETISPEQLEIITDKTKNVIDGIQERKKLKKK